MKDGKIKALFNAYFVRRQAEMVAAGEIRPITVEDAARDLGIPRRNLNRWLERQGVEMQMYQHKKTGEWLRAPVKPPAAEDPAALADREAAAIRRSSLLSLPIPAHGG